MNINDELPNEVISHIFSFTRVHFTEVSSVCRLWRDLASPSTRRVLAKFAKIHGNIPHYLRFLTMGDTSDFDIRDYPVPKSILALAIRLEWPSLVHRMSEYIDMACFVTMINNDQLHLISSNIYLSLRMSIMVANRPTKQKILSGILRINPSRVDPDLAKNIASLQTQAIADLGDVGNDECVCAAVEIGDFGLYERCRNIIVNPENVIKSAIIGDNLAVYEDIITRKLVPKQAGRISKRAPVKVTAEHRRLAITYKAAKIAAKICLP